MRRLTALFRRLRGCTQDLHIADLELRLSALVDARHALDAEIDATVSRLVQAIAKRRPAVQTPAPIPHEAPHGRN